MENDELAQHLESLKREDCYRVDAVLKQSEFEVTERVYFVGDNGAETGPYIRKFIRQAPGIGAAYERIFAAQHSGHRFKYVPDILECYARSSYLVVVMEHVHGETLQDAVYRLDPSVKLAAHVFPRLCDAVGELHDELDPPIIHRDLKPSNIILSPNGLAIIDFGIAREYDSDSYADTAHFGTRGFAPPEQFGFGQTTVRSDIYSLGMVLFFCLTEEMPDSAIRERGFANERIPEPMRQVIARATAFDPAQRFANARELKQAFCDALGNHGDANLPNSAPRAEAAQSEDKPARRSSGRRVGIVVALIACAIIAIVVAIGATTCSRQDSASSEVSSSGQSTTASTPSSEAENTSESEPSSETSDAAAAADGTTDSQSDGDSAGASLDETELTESLNTAAVPKDGFDPATNFTVTIAGVEFQIPRYFKSKTAAADTAHHYYAETGSSVVEIMTDEQYIEGNSTREDFEEMKDTYLSGVMESNPLFTKLVSSTDFELAGLSARIATFRGTVKGVSVTTKMVYFYDPALQTLGSLTFGQSDNAQFDYSTDFAKIVSSARSTTPDQQSSS